MYSKVWKILKEVAIGILLVLSLWLVINGALEKSKGHFEFGSLMDFFNTAGTLGTLFVAYLVYRNAPKWINQKLDDHALNIAKELITHDLPTLFLKLRETSIYIQTFHDCYKNNITDSYKVIREFIKLDENIKLCDDLNLNCRLKISSLEKLGWSFNDSVVQESITLRSAASNYISYLKAFKLQSDVVAEVTTIKHRINNDVNVPFEIEKLYNIAQNNAKLSSKFMISYKNFNEPIRLITHYFNVSNIK